MEDGEDAEMEEMDVDKAAEELTEEKKAGEWTASLAFRAA